MEYLIIFISAIFVNNIVLTQFLGICPFLGVSKKISTSLGMGAAVIFVITLATIVTWLIQHYLLNPFNLGFLQTIAFILVIASFVTVLQLLMQAYLPSIYETLGLFIPLIVVNCIVLGRAEAYASKNNVFDSAVDGISMGLGFAMALTILGSIREILGSGSIFGWKFIAGDGILVFVLAPGAFIAMGYLIAIMNRLLKKTK